MDTRDRGQLPKGAEEDPSDDANAGAFPVAGALLNRSGGEWFLSAPPPSPVREPAARGEGRDRLIWRVPPVNVRL